MLFAPLINDVELCLSPWSLTDFPNLVNIYVLSRIRHASGVGAGGTARGVITYHIGRGDSPRIYLFLESLICSLVFLG